MGSDIQSLAIPAKGYDFFTNHTAGITPLEIQYPHPKPRSHLETLCLLPSAARKRPLRYAGFVETQLIGTQEAVIT
jgi:hypothetical protein